MTPTVDSDSERLIHTMDLSQEEDEIRISLRNKVVYSVPKAALKKFPKTLLGRLSETDSNFNPVTRRYAFERSTVPGFMECLLNFYIDGTNLHLPPGLCNGLAREEMNFWGIKPELLAPCCFDTFQKEEENDRVLREMCETLQPGLERIKKLTLKRQQAKTAISVGSGGFDDWENVQLGTRDKIWAFFEDPHSSKCAFVWSSFVSFVVFLTVLCAGLETFPFFRSWQNETQYAEYMKLTEGQAEFLIFNSSPIIYSFIIEVVETAVLSIDLMGHFFASRHKLYLCKCFIYPIQTFIVLAMIAIISRQLQPNSILEFKTNQSFIIPISVCIKMLHVVLLLKLTYNYRLLFLLFMAIQKSWREIALLVAIMSLNIMAFSLVIYYAELEVGTFNTMAECYWWAIVTMTTVGYGDFSPKTVLGRLIGAICLVIGVIIVAIPIAVIGNNFAHYYVLLGKIDRLNHLNNKRQKYFQE